MTEVLVGILAIAIGSLLCLRGQGTLRFLLALWGAIIGFGAGARAVERWTEEGYLDSPLGWIAAIVGALLFAALAYLYFAVGVVLAMAAMGFVIGGSAAATLGVESPAVLLGIGAAAGVALGLLAIIGNLPQLVLIVVSSLAGAAIVVGGILLMVGEESVLGSDGRTVAEHSPGWAVPAMIAIALVGVVVQMRQLTPDRRSVRENWR